MIKIEGGSNHVRFKSVICIATALLSMSKWDWPEYHLINIIWEVLSPTCQKNTLKHAVTAHQHIDWLQLFILIQIKAPFLFDLNLSCLWFNLRKWLLTSICWVLDHHVGAAWLNRVALIECVDCVAVNENYIYNLNTRHAINMCFHAFV